MYRSNKFHVTVITLFPEMFPGPLAFSIIGNTLKSQEVIIDTINPRDFSNNGRVDDYPYGGGPGMIMRADILSKAIESHQQSSIQKGNMVYPTPRGRAITQKDFEKWTHEKYLTILCGRYEGIDQRIIEHYNFDEVSISDFILCGGEIPAMAIIEGCARLIAIGNKESLIEESFTNGLLEHSQYTYPRKWNHKHVPEVLLSGNHKKILDWKYNNSCEITKQNRKDLWIKYILNMDR